jgi:protein phosphatase
MVVMAGTSTPGIRIRSAVSRSDAGRARKANEDAVLCLDPVPLYAVADGTGGPEAARVALTVLRAEAVALSDKKSLVAARPDSASRLGVGRFLDELFHKANAKVFGAAEKIPDRRIATTLSLLTIVGGHAFVGHVGNSRVYLWRRGRLRQLTSDHTLAAVQLARGAISAEAFEASRFRGTLAQALGTSRGLDVELLELRLCPGDGLIVSSDGLSRALPDDAIAACLAAEGDADGRADRLLTRVREAGAPDDTSFALVEIDASARPELRVDELEAAARASCFFAELGDCEWHQVLPYLDLIAARPGEVLCRSGDDALGLGVVGQGRFTVQHPGGEAREIGPSQHFGALALATDGPGDETVRASEHGLLYVLTRTRYFELLRREPKLGSELTLSLLEVLGSRLGVLTTRLGHVFDAADGQF